MFNLFKKKDTNENEMNAPVKGKCIDITDVKDPVFSGKMMGDGVAVIPESNVIKSPCSGTVTMIFPTKHAFGITTNTGVEVLVHIGIDTVNLNGKGFIAYVSKDQKIQKGDKVIAFDSKYLSDSAMDMTTMIIVTNSNNHSFEKNKVSMEVSEKDAIISLK
ncbi:MAG: PTS glucose transporter subunit IIA [Erysipelotrichaceae bacterium]|uniref:PTS sugar transporter subunit IIA n=1 Tax=Floccifex sp. TaxID=2815810 RepID=UPI002A75ABD1|nr:PTS glucose transporter subunit IIA [Floccifex sp.]MDD7281466.1 PTS glucose transporter subunit IIA [Erysipelotrichaceae bacterium]MDY2957388.1 PTS glucose transporter subunit IIA [Floccifex sp.]